MKILLVHNYYGIGPVGGEDMVVRSEHDFLQNAGYQVSTKYYINAETKIQQVFSVLFEPFNPLEYFKFKNYLKKDKPNIVHIHNWHYRASPSIIWAAKSLKIPVVLTIHNYRLLCPSATLLHNNQLFLESLKERFFWSAIKKKVYVDSYFVTAALSATLLFNKFIKTWQKVDKFIFLNDFMANLYRDSYLKIKNSQIEIKPNFVVNRQVNGLDYSRKRDGFLYVGRLSEEKGIDILLEAFSGSGHKLKIIGDGPLKSKVLAGMAGNENMEYLGFQTKEVIIKAMEESEALVFPSIWYEGMPITILEALSCGTPIIASNIGSMTSLVTDRKNGMHFQVGSSKDLRNKLQLWKNLSLVEKHQFRKMAYEHYLKEFTPEINLAKLVEIYHKVLSKSNKN